MFSIVLDSLNIFINLFYTKIKIFAYTLLLFITHDFTDSCICHLDMYVALNSYNSEHYQLSSNHLISAVGLYLVVVQFSPLANKS